MEWLFDILLLVIIFWLGKQYQHWKIIGDIYTNPDHYIELAKKVKEMKEEDPIPGIDDTSGTEVNIERHGDMVYAYTKQDDQFIAQGKNMTELLESMKKRFPNRRFFGTIDKDSPAKELV